MSDNEAEKARRRLAAKRHNERLKLLIVSINTAALTIFGAALILPRVSGSRQEWPVTWIWSLSPYI